MHILLTKGYQLTVCIRVHSHYPRYLRYVVDYNRSYSSTRARSANTDPGNYQPSYFN